MERVPGNSANLYIFLLEKLFFYIESNMVCATHRTTAVLPIQWKAHKRSLTLKKPPISLRSELLTTDATNNNRKCMHATAQSRVANELTHPKYELSLITWKTLGQ